MPLAWRECEGECPNCGVSPVEVLALHAGTVRDGDPVRCDECGLYGMISADSETDPYIEWDSPDTGEEG